MYYRAVTANGWKFYVWLLDVPLEQIKDGERRFFKKRTLGLGQDGMDVGKYSIALGAYACSPSQICSLRFLEFNAS